MKRIFSFLLALCLCASLMPAAHAEENVPTPQEVYDILIGFRETEGYTEGTPWTNAVEYTWHGGTPQTGGGCMAFAYKLSDAAFGNLPARMFSSFALSDVKAGDILRLNHNTHGVIVLQANDAGVVIAEGNYNGTVHWGRTLTKSDVENADYLLTRYPEGYDPGVNPDDPMEGAAGDFGGLHWELTNGGTLTISGAGAMPELDGGTPPWADYAGRILKIVISSGVTTVSANAFRGSSVLSAVIPASVTSIGDSAFRECPNLIAAAIPEGVESIGGNAFRSCAALKSITLPASVREVGAGAFFQCTAMTEAVFTPGAALVTMGDNVFTQCYALEKAVLPKQMDRISEGMFQNCLSLASLTVPEGTESIGGSAFASCSRLTQVWIPDSVTSIGIAAFSDCSLTAIYFGGSEEQWNGIAKIGDTAAALSGVTKYYGAQAPETPDTPGTPDTPDTPDTPETPDTPDTPSVPEEHRHIYGDWVIDVNPTASQSGSRHRTCSICGGIQTERIPASGSSSSNASGSSSGSSSITTTTTRNPDGSTTTTRTDHRTGTVTETTKNPDGSQTVVETKKDGTVTTRETDQAGNKTETAASPDGSSVITVEKKGGTAAAVRIDASGKTEADVRLPASLVRAAQRSGEAIPLPIPEVRTAQSAQAASTVTVHTGSKLPVKVEIPTAVPAPGTVAVIVHADGTEEIVKTSIPTAGGVAASLPDGAVVKLVDNSRDFADISSQYWAADAISFVSARKLFSGTTETVFTPEAPMTCAMLMVVLARLDGVDTAGGGTWYEKGMEWAVAHGISDGSNPDQRITREQLVTMLWRYMDFPSAADPLSRFTDADQISGYAQEAVRWAVEKGIVSGSNDGLLAPQGPATRAQVAQILKNFMEQYS